jgi:type IV pilus assembly protein PilC
VGEVIHDYAQNRFTRTLGTLVSGGIPLVTSLDLASRAVGNRFFENKLLEVTTGVREGQTLWESLDRTHLISDMTVEMIKVGESTGALTEMLDCASEFSEEEIDHKLAKLITIIEPAMLVFMALVVTGVLLSLYMPMIRAAGSSRF